MSFRDEVRRITREITSPEVGQTLNWNKNRKKIVSLHDQAETESEIETCLALYKSLMDAVERQISIGDRESLQEARRKEYRTMLIKEAVRGRTDGIIEPKIMASITKREVQAGRMSADDDLHTLAVAGDQVLTSAPPAQGRSFLKRMFGR